MPLIGLFAIPETPHNATRYAHRGGVLRSTPESEPWMDHPAATGGLITGHDDTPIFTQTLIDTMSGYVIKATDLLLLGALPGLEQLNSRPLTRGA